MRRDPKACLWDVQQDAERIASFLAGHDIERYQTDVLLRSAVERQFEIIGEALAQLAKLEPALVAQVPRWQEIVAFRNLLIHGYAVIEDARVWAIARTNLPEVARAVDALLAQP